MVTGKGAADSYLSESQIREIVQESLATLKVDDKRVLVLIPDGTRTMPMPLMFKLFQEILAPRTAALDYLVALGTHQPMPDAQLSELVGPRVVDGCVGKTHIYTHEWYDPSMLRHIGTIPASEIQQLSEGRFSQDVLPNIRPQA